MTKRSAGTSVPFYRGWVQVPTTGQISFTIQETGKVNLVSFGSNDEVVDAVTIKSQKDKGRLFTSFS